MKRTKHYMHVSVSEPGFKPLGIIYEPGYSYAVGNGILNIFYLDDPIPVESFKNWTVVRKLDIAELIETLESFFNTDLEIFLAKHPHFFLAPEDCH